MRNVLVAMALAALGLSAVPAGAQVQLNVCGIAPLPPCGPPPGAYGRRPPPPDFDDEDRDFGRVCRTRYETCRVRPRPMGARCSCESDDGEEVVGRVVR